VETALAVVHGIDVKVDEHGELIGSGGTLRVERPWKPREPDLTPTRYRYTPRGT
jgi:hypothetical protein